MNAVIIADIANYSRNGKSTGHYYAVASNYLDVFGNCKIAGGPVYHQKFDKSRIVDLPFDTKVGQNVIVKKWHQLRNCISLFRQTKGGTVVMQQAALSTAIFAIMLFKRFYDSKLYMIVYDKAGVNTLFKSLCWTIAKKYVKGVICPNEDVGQAYDKPYLIVPDYIYVGDKRSSVTSRSNKIYDFCVVGRISPEKAVDEIVNVLRNTPFHVLIAGKPQTKELGEKISSLVKGADNIDLHLGYVDDEQYDMYIRQSKYCVLNYKGEYSNRSSGVVLDTLFKGTPVVGCRCKALQFIEENKVGCLYDRIEDLRDGKILMDVDYEMVCSNIESYKAQHGTFKARLVGFVNS